MDEHKNKIISAQSTIKAMPTMLSNGKISIKLDEKTGAILEVSAEGINAGNNLVKGNSSNLTLGFEDTPKQWPAWNLKEEYWKHPVNLPNDKDVKIEVIENGPVFATIAVTRTLGISPVSQKITLFTGCEEVFLEYLTDWKQPEVMLKVLYSTATEAENSVADIVYGAITRKTKPEVPCDKARYEKICHKYFDLSTPSNEWGIALLNEGKYAFDTDGGDFRLTMLRSPPYPGASGESWAHKERAVNLEKYNHEVPKFSGLGPFKCKYALLAHRGGTLVDAKGNPNGRVKRAADEFNEPVVVIPVSKNINANSLPHKELLGTPLLTIMTPNVYLGTLKFNEWEKTGSIIIRMVESSGMASLANVKINSVFCQRIKSIRAIDLLERPVDFQFNWDPAQGLLKFDIKKFEICTFEILL
jgi:alpha-mannosidase